MDLPCFSLQDFEERIKNEAPADPLCDRIGQGDKDECQKDQVRYFPVAAATMARTFSSFAFAAMSQPD